MNYIEVGELLARIQLVDNRRVDEAVIEEWHRYLAEVDDFAAAMEAVTLHRMESRSWLMPVDILANIERIRLAGVERTDEWGNRIEPDAAAVAALERIQRGRGEQRAVTS